MSGNPPSPEFLTICDTLGLLVLDEAFDKWKSGYYEPFYDENAHNDIADMVLRDRNHPSVIVWSIGNEVSEAWKTDDEGVNRARELNDNWVWSGLRINVRSSIAVALTIFTSTRCLP